MRPQTALASAPVLVIPTIGWNTHSDWLNVKSYGAVGDGAADDTNAVQAAITAASSPSTPFSVPPIFFPAGIYRLTATLTMSQVEGAHWIGTGATSILKWAGASGGTMYHSNGVTVSSYEGLTFDGSGSAGVGVDHASIPSTGGGYYETNIQYANMHFENFTDSEIRVDQTEHLAAGITFTPTAETLITNSLFENSPNCLLFSDYNAADNKVEASAFKNCGTAVNVLHGNVDITRCNFYGSTATDINFSDFSNRVTSSVSLGSHSFVRTPQYSSSGETMIENDVVDGWTDPIGAVNSTMHNQMIIMDTRFSNGPAGSLPVQFKHVSGASQQLILTNTTNNGSLLTSDVVLPSSEVRITPIPANLPVQSLIDINTVFLSGLAIVARPVIDVTAYGAHPEDNVDDTAAIAAAITAAKAANNGSSVYFPSGRYAITQPIAVTGSNYALSGAGFDSSFNWRGTDQQQCMVTVQDPQNVVIEHLNFGTHPDDMCSVKQVSGSTAGAKSNISYKDVYFGYDTLPDPGQNQPNISPTRTFRGLELNGLTTGAVVQTDFVLGPLRVTNSSAATVLINEFIGGAIVVEGPTASRNGYMGVVYGADAGHRYDMTVKDNQSLTAGYMYTESTQRYLRVEGNGNATPGHVTISGARVKTFDPEIASIQNYAGRVSLLSANSDYQAPTPFYPPNNPPATYKDANGNVSYPALQYPISPDTDCGSSVANTFCVKGSAPLTFALFGENFTNPGLPAVVVPASTRVVTLDNGNINDIFSGPVDDTAQPGDQKIIAESLNDLRQLRDLDLLIHSPQYARTDQTRIFLDAGNKAIGNTLGADVAIYNAQTGQLAVDLPNQRVWPNGEIMLDQASQLNGLSDSATYTLLVKLPNFLTRKIANVSNLLTKPVLMSSAAMLSAGDSQGTDHISLSALVTYVRLFNSQVNDTDWSLYRTLNEHVSISDFVDLIRQFNQRPDGDTP